MCPPPAKGPIWPLYPHVISLKFWHSFVIIVGDLLSCGCRSPHILLCWPIMTSVKCVQFIKFAYQGAASLLLSPAHKNTTLHFLRPKYNLASDLLGRSNMIKLSNMHLKRQYPWFWNGQAHPRRSTLVTLVAPHYHFLPSCTLWCNISCDQVWHLDLLVLYQSLVASHLKLSSMCCCVVVWLLPCNMWLLFSKSLNVCYQDTDVTTSTALLFLYLVW